MDEPDVKPVVARRATCKGVFTRHLNSLTRLMLEPFTGDTTALDDGLGKLTTAKEKFDETHDALMEVLRTKEICTMDLEAQAVDVDTIYTEGLTKAKSWRTPVVAETSTHSDAAGAGEGEGSSKSSDDVKKSTELLQEQIMKLSLELEQAKNMLLGQPKISSTPLTGVSRRVNFDGASTSAVTPGSTGIAGLSTIPEAHVGGSSLLPHGDKDERLIGSKVPPPVQGLSLGDITGGGAKVGGGGAETEFSLMQQQLFQQSALQHQSMMASVHAPRIQLEQFDGDPLRYTTFIQSYTDLVDNVLYNSRTKLMILENHCVDKAKRVVEACVHLEAGAGLKKALANLRAKFGSPYMIRQAWLERILAYPTVNTPELTENFAYDLECCRHSLDTLGQLSEAECTNTLQLLVAKLPHFLRIKWRKVYRKHVESPVGSPLDLLIGIVRDAADDATDPAFGESIISRVKNTYAGSTNPGLRGPRTSQLGRRGAINLVSDQELEDEEETESYEEAEIFAVSKAPPCCAVCGSSGHFTSRCHKYRILVPDDRLAMVRRKKLCHLCLSDGHLVTSCPLPWKCQDKDCGRRHHTSLHRAFLTDVQPIKNVAGTPQQSVHQLNEAGDIEEPSTVVDQSMFLTVNSPCLPLTPVRLVNGKESIVSYALLDSGSTMTICTKRVMARLNLPSHGIKTMNVSTVANPVLMKGDMVRFNIGPESGTEMFPVREAMTLERLPISLDHLARGSSLSKWKHLRRVNIPLGSADQVDLLIGQDNAHLLEQFEKVTGDLFEPYAVNTRLGWTVFGNLQEGEEARHSTMLTIGSEIILPSVERAIEGSCHIRVPEIESEVEIEQNGCLEATVLDTCPVLEESTQACEADDDLPDLCYDDDRGDDTGLYMTAEDDNLPDLCCEDDSWDDIGLFVPSDGSVGLSPPDWMYVTDEGSEGGVMFDEMEGAVQAVFSCAENEFDFITPALIDSLQKYWIMEQVPESVGMSPDDVYVLELWEREYRLVDGHVELPIPFMENSGELENNFMVALKHLECLGRRLLKNPVELAQYVEAMNKNFEMRYAEVVPPCEIDFKGLVWYLLHHGVDHPRKPGVTRVVTNGSAKFKGLSLNMVTYKGPDLMNSLLSVLVRFRQYRYASQADIEGMFNQVKVPIPQRNAQRFLFWKDGKPGGEVIICRMTGHIFGTGWAPAAANYALKRLAKDAEPRVGPEVANSVDKEFYVDDWLNGEPEEECAAKRFGDVRDVLKGGGFNLGKLASCSRTVLSSVEVSQRAKEVAKIDLSSEHLPPGVTLGQHWFPELDHFGFGFRPEPKPLTRRGLMSCVASLYDPLGFLVPFILPAKVLMQQICKSGARWDESLPVAVGQQWSRWLEELPKVNEWEVARWIGCSRTSVNTLHHFGDACIIAYGGVTYLVVFEPGSSIKKAIIISAKSKLAPIRYQTIPRLELGAATLIVKMDVALKKCFSVPLEKSRFYSDSDIVLKMLLRPAADFEPFVRNRVSFIQEHSSTDQWSHISGKENPADLASRGCTMEALLASKLWLHGPEVLRHPDTVCVGKLELDDLPEDFEELRKVKPVFATVSTKRSMVGVEGAADNCRSKRLRKESIEREGAAVMAELNPLLAVKRPCEDDSKPEPKKLRRGARTGVKRKVEQDAEHDGCNKRGSVSEEVEARDMIPDLLRRYSSLMKTHRAIAWLIRVRQCLMSKCWDGQDLTVEELNRAEEVTVKLNQRYYLSEEHKRSAAFVKLNPVWESECLVVGGRLQYSNHDERVKHPWIVPPGSPLVKQVITEAHAVVGHSSLDRTLLEVRSGYWILGGRREVREVLAGCLICKRFKAAAETQLMGPLPLTRTESNKPPFANSGVDLFGPLPVVVKRSSVKRYGVLFTCFSCRAVHIEVAEDLSTSAFLRVLERFSARRGKPESLHSDNGTNLVGSRNRIEGADKLLEDPLLRRALTNRRIVWRLNTPAASHQGGAWERMIRTVRSLMTVIVNQQAVTEDVLHTSLCMIEGIINSRPLTRINDDPHSLMPLAPSHLLHLKSTGPLFPQDFTGDRLRRDWRQAQYLCCSFWKKWLKLYLPELQKRTKWTRGKKNLAVGEMVLIVDDTCARGQWPIAIVQEVHPGRDGYVRNVTVRTADGTYRRPVQKIVRLEADGG